MDIRTIKWDIVFIIVLAGFLLYLSHIDRMEILLKLPFVTIYIAYVIGRVVGSKTAKRTDEKLNVNEN